MRDRILRWLRIPERPSLPPGREDDIRVFRPARGFLIYSAIVWIPNQVAAFAGLLFSLAFFGKFDQPFLRAEGWERFISRLERFQIPLGEITADPTWFFDFLEALAVAAWLAQLLFTGLLIKLSWEMRWYMVGDEALRLREGLWKLREQTLTLANVQNLTVKQNPVQRLLGLADLEVRTAGGGTGDEGEEGALHIARFRGLEDAEGLRDHLLRRLERYRDAGLGEARPAVARRAETESPGDPAELTAARTLLTEVRALGEALRRRRISLS